MWWSIFSQRATAIRASGKHDFARPKRVPSLLKGDQPSRIFAGHPDFRLSVGESRKHPRRGRRLFRFITYTRPVN